MRTLANTIALSTSIAAVALMPNRGKGDGNNFKGMIESRIADLAKAEVTSHEMLALLSRDLLTYVPDTGDIGMVNRLLDACKTRNREYAVLFFNEHLPWNVEANAVGADYFTTKSKNKAVIEKHYARIAEFLKDEKATIWTWVKENVRPPVLTRNFVRTIANAVENALKDEKSIVEETITKADGSREVIQRKPTVKDIILAIQEGGINVADIIGTADAMKREWDEAEKREEERKAAENAGTDETQEAGKKADAKAATPKRGRPAQKRQPAQANAA